MNIFVFVESSSRLTIDADSFTIVVSFLLMTGSSFAATESEDSLGLDDTM